MPYITKNTGKQIDITLLENDKAVLDIKGVANIQQTETKSKEAKSYFDRGLAYYKTGQYDEAISEYTKVIEINPKVAEAYGNRGLAYGRKGQYDLAIADFNKAIEINPMDGRAYNSLAWLFATAEVSDFRNGKRAVELALRACELSHWKNLNFYDTLAAAYARVGDFENAVKYQQKALESPEVAKDKEAQQRLNLYRELKPWPVD
jgi:tetratricopeptide (TPR) repeat protein